MNDTAIVVTEYIWAGRLGPFRIKTHCSDCDVTASVIDTILQNELKDMNVTFERKPWLDNFFYCLFRGAWHAPIVMINGKKFHQFSHAQPLFDRKLFVSVIRKELNGGGQ